MIRASSQRCAMLMLVLALAATGGAGAQVMDVPGCGTLSNAYGPYDYTNGEDVRLRLPIVEQHHFDRGVDSLKGHAFGASSVGADLAYTLRAFPNHHRALDAMGRFQLREKQTPPSNARYSAECWFERAMQFAPKDGTVHMVYGIYLARKGDMHAALERYEEALEMLPESAELHYNMGLLYADLGRYEEALVEAHAAYARNFPLPGLRNKLLRAGAWRDAPPAAPTPEAAPEQAAPAEAATAGPTAPEETEEGG